jgi:hypothetical protein
MTNILSRFGAYVSRREGFLRFGILSFGVVSSAVTLWLGWDEGGIAWRLLIVVLCFGLGWVWTLVMWEIFKQDMQRIPRQPESESSSQNDRPTKSTHST